MFLLSNCLFVVSDGIGLQLEAYLLNKPTLILRDTTETQGVGETGVLSGLNPEKVTEFLQTYSDLKKKATTHSSPSKKIADILKEKFS